MRKELQEIEQIENYLLNKMTNQEKADFEQRISQNAELKNKVEAQKQVMEGIAKMALKQSVKRSYRSYKMKALLTKLILVIAGLTIAGFVALKVINTASEGSELGARTEVVTDTLKTKANDILDANTFMITTANDTVIESQDGVVIYIPENAFETDVDEVELKVQSAINGADMMLAGLSTMSDSNQLETGGMFYVDALANGQRVSLVKDLHVNVPTDQKLAGMMHYQGEKMVDGDINWVKPKPLPKNLIPVDILSLDFYPPNYEDKLKEWGYSGKQFTDSLYYSFAFGDQNHYEILSSESKNDTLSSVKDGFIDQVTLSLDLDNSSYLPDDIHKVITWSHDAKLIGKNTYLVTIKAVQRNGWRIFSQKQPKGSTAFPTEFNFYSNQKFQLIGETKEYGDQLISEKFPERSFTGRLAKFAQVVKIEENCDLNVDYTYMACQEPCFPPTDEKFTISLKLSNQGINPASIKTIWNEKFNNTILATKEFEERMPFIHETCNQKVLDLYINNLDKGLSEIDSLVIPFVSGDLKQKFADFFKRGDGKVYISDIATNKLGGFYAKKLALETKAIQKTKNDFWSQQLKLDNINSKEYRSSIDRNLKNKTDVFNKEYLKNLCKVYEEVDYPYDCANPAPPVAKAYYTIPVRNLGWHNIDRQVYEATAKRESTTILYNGKTSSLTYKEWTGQLIDYNNYDQVYVYNLPQMFNSYVKLNSNGNGAYNYKLNADLDYETLVLAWKEDQFFYSQTNTNAGQESIKLKSISKADFKKKLSKRNANISDLEKELAYIQFEQKDQKRINSNSKRKQLRSKIEPIIFPCRTEIKSVHKVVEIEGDIIYD